MSIAGKWNVTMQTPIGTQNFVWDLKPTAEGWTGTMVTVTGTSAMNNIRATDRTFEWESDIKSPMGDIHLVFSGEVDGETLSGTCRTKFGDSTFTAARA